MIINIFEARNRLSGLIKLARAGENVVIANRGKPTVRLVPVEEEASGKGDVMDILGWLDEHPLPADARRDARQIDADIEAERASWE